MSLTTTTLASACAANDRSIVVTSATDFSAGRKIMVDGELMQIINAYVSGTTIPVLRGQDGTYAYAHPSGANASVGTGLDFTNPAPQVNDSYPIAGRARTVTSYTADGAIALPTPGNDAVAILNGTSQWDMTLAQPTKDMDGCILWIIGNGKSAHTVTITAGIGNAGSGYTVLTFDTGGQCMVAFMAANAIWVSCPSPLSGTLTAVDVAVA